MKNTRKYEAVKENIAGDFYVKEGCCTLCGVPPAEAPGLFGGFDENFEPTHEQCFVKKQPSDTQELDQMITTMAAQEMLCIRYSGDDEVIKQELRNVGEGDQIDF